MDAVRVGMQSGGESEEDAERREEMETVGLL